MGALAGHMSHVYENMYMTFSQFIEIFRGVTDGTIEVTEKVDGKNLYFRYDHNEKIAKFARNSTHTNQGGLTRKELREDFERKGGGDPKYQHVIDAFDNGMDAIERSLSNIDESILNQIFKIPGIYVNCEVMYSVSGNIVVFDGNFIVLHNMDIVDESLTPVDMTPDEQTRLSISAREAFKTLVDQIKKQEAIVAKEVWKVVGPTIIKIKNLAETDFIDRLEQAVDQILDDTQLTYKNKFIDFVRISLRSAINSTFTVTPDQETFEDILQLVTETGAEKKQRVASGKVINLRVLKQKHPYSMDFVALKNVASSQSSKKILGIILEPFAQLVAHFSAELLSDAKSEFAANPEQAKMILQSATQLALDDMENQIEQVFSTGGSDRARALRSRFEKNIARLGNVSNITTGMEGVVFEYPPMSSRFYKFTGGFAAANQLLGLAGFKQKEDYLQAAKQKHGY